MRWITALTAAVLTAALVVAGWVLAALEPTATTLGIAAAGTLLAGVTAALGLVVARRARANVVGALLVLVALGEALTATREVGWRVLAAHPDTAAQLNWLVALLAESSIWLFAALALLLLCFPDGRPYWRFVAPALLVAAAIHHGYGAVDVAPYAAPLHDVPHRWGPPPFAVELAAFLADVTLLGLLIACAASLFARYRRSGELRRRQIRWLALAGAGVPGFIVVCLAEIALTGHSGWAAGTVALATGLGIPLATAVAMLRHDLYDVDRALAATVGYGLATAVLLVVFAAASAAAGVIFGHDSTVVAAAATALAAVALSPLRRRLQRRVDRRLYPQRQAALAAIAGLQREIHAGDARPEQLAERLRAALRDPTLRIGYRVPGAAVLVDETGAPLTSGPPVLSGDAPTGAVGGHGTPVMLGGAPTGAIVAAVSAELLREVAAASATLVEVVRLRLEVTAALREVEASRARLLHAGYAERRRLERDLHDGAQQRLVSLGMALRLAQRHLGTVDVDGLIDETVAELGTAVAELRQIAHGLRPSSLDDGLPAALAALTQHVPIPVGLDVQAPDPLPDDVATTAYFVISEAIANAVKHAGASRIDVRVARVNGHLAVRVSDDGCGGAAPAPGSGLSGLSDRVGAVGGALALDSRQGSGTTVEATVPCAS
jgi:signal transduction histidine kinase